jgi:hypothetical protein
LPEAPALKRGLLRQFPFPFGKFTKIFLKSWHIFKPSRNGHQQTTIHHESTINSPQKHHQKTAHLPKPPSKTPVKAQKKPRPPPELFF